MQSTCTGFGIGRLQQEIRRSGGRRLGRPWPENWPKRHRRRRMIKQRSVGWTGHVTCMRDEKFIGYTILVAKSEQNRPFESLKSKWKDNTVTYSQVLFHDGTLLHSKSQYAIVNYNPQRF
jgi:hypothetical protein